MSASTKKLHHLLLLIAMMPLLILVLNFNVSSVLNLYVYGDFSKVLYSTASLLPSLSVLFFLYWYLFKVGNLNFDSIQMSRTKLRHAALIAFFYIIFFLIGTIVGDSRRVPFGLNSIAFTLNILLSLFIRDVLLFGVICVQLFLLFNEKYHQRVSLFLSSVTALVLFVAYNGLNDYVWGGFSFYLITWIIGIFLFLKTSNLLFVVISYDFLIILKYYLYERTHTNFTLIITCFFFVVVLALLWKRIFKDVSFFAPK